MNDEELQKLLNRDLKLSPTPKDEWSQIETKIAIQDSRLQLKLPALMACMVLILISVLQFNTTRLKKLDDLETASYLYESADYFEEEEEYFF